MQNENEQPKKKKVIRKSLKSKQRVNDKLAIQLQPIILSF